MIFAITSALDLFVQWLAIYGYTKLVTMFSPSSYSPSQHNIAYLIFLSLLLPTSFQVVSVSVLIWENSNTTRALGSLLITCWQCLAISLITINTGIHYSFIWNLIINGMAIWCLSFITNDK